jgi:hypothetical protein
MENTQTTLNDFFSTREFIETRLDEFEKSEQFNSLKENMGKALKGVTLPSGFYKLVIKQVSDLLRIDVRDILARGWSKYSEFLEYLNKDKYPPGEPAFVPLAKHTIVSEHSPSLKPVINKITLGEIQFTVHLEFLLKGAVLKIDDGKIMEARIGTCEGKGNVQYGGFTILEAKSQPVEFPGSIEFGEGVPIEKPGEEISKLMDEVTEEDEETNKNGG